MVEPSVRELLDHIGGPHASEIILDVLRRWRVCHNARTAQSILEVVSEYLNDSRLPSETRMAVAFLLGEMMHEVP